MKLPNAARFYIGGEWVTPQCNDRQPVINPATEAEIGQVALGNKEDVNLAVAAAKSAFPGFAKTSVKERFDLLHAVNEALITQNDEIAFAISQAMGAPMSLAKVVQAPSGPQHFGQMLKVLESFNFEERMGTTIVRHEPVGICALITPWNWPMNQIAAKVAPALAAGCTIVLKPSELAPFDAVILADIMDKAGIPKGVFNLIHGDGAGVGAALTSHEDVDMVSFTGSTKAGIEISKAAATTLKRVSLELGGKSATIITPTANLNQAVAKAVRDVMVNSGQSCNAQSRILVQKNYYDEATKIASETAQNISIGLPENEVAMGPLANRAQYDKVRSLIDLGIKEGASCLAGGSEKPSDIDKGYFVKPTILGNVSHGMTVARAEIFGPVVTLTAYDDLEEAIAIANDSAFGLSGAVYAGTDDEAYDIACQIRTGMVHINGAGLDSAAPFGGYKMSGNGREWGIYGLEEFLEVKSVYGAAR